MHVCFFSQISKDGESYEVPLHVARMSKLVENNYDEEEDDDEDAEANIKEIPLPNVAGTVLKKVIEYCDHYRTEEMTPIQTPLKSGQLDELVQPFYANFVKVRFSCFSRRCFGSCPCRLDYC
jgi:S-phase kinase-associated protein 1